MILIIQEWIQDFQEGSANPKGGGDVNLLFGQIFLKTAWE